jgi:hypothetical protein
MCLTIFYRGKDKKRIKKERSAMSTNKDKEKYLDERNEKSKAFKEDRETQLERDQTVMPIDELPLEDIKMENQEERDKEDTKDHSSSE